MSIYTKPKYVKIGQMNVLTRFLLISLIFLQSNCTNEESPTATSEQAEIARSLFSPSITQFTIRAFYEAGATPYTGAIGLSGNDTWDISKTSYESLFQAHSGRTVTTPAVLADMTGIPDQGVSNWTPNQLVALGESLAPALISNNTATVSIIFLNGQFNGSSSTLGVHIGGTRFAFVFKDIVVSVGGGDTSQKYIEQATVVHEIGHTIGFVNNGVPMVAGHEDSAHPHHTTNEDGVMYWAVESTNGVLTFLTDIITGGQLNLFGPETLQDGQSYQP